jgi:AcrR family transcriptional regulator
MGRRTPVENSRARTRRGRSSAAGTLAGEPAAQRRTQTGVRVRAVADPQTSIVRLGAGRRGTQRERLLAAISSLLSRDSLDAVTVSEIVALARVSRPSFYEHFTDKEDCFLAALGPLRRQLLAEIGAAVAAGPPEHAAGATMRALLAFADSEPVGARLLISDPLAAGRRSLDARDELIAAAARPIEESFARVPSGAPIPALAPRLLVGVSCRLLASRLRRGEACSAEMLRELLDWLASYELPAGEHGWRGARGLTPASDCSPLTIAALRAPPALASRRPRIRVQAASENQWLRIVFATAEIVMSDGYAASTVAHITQQAGVNARAFYRLFSCKEQALAAAREMFFRHAMAQTAGAFATGASWPARVREAGVAFTRCVEQNPALAYVSFTEGHAGGPVAMGRLQELVSAFTIFLQEGYRFQAPVQARRARPPSGLALQAAVTSVFELCYLQGRGHGAPGLTGMSEQIVFICLAPFLRAPYTNKVLQERLSPARDEELLRHPAERSEQSAVGDELGLNAVA